MEIFRITTARNTTYTIGERYDTSLDSPKLTNIDCSLNDGWCVFYSNGVKISIHDVVEIWSK